MCPQGKVKAGGREARQRALRDQTTECEVVRAGAPRTAPHAGRRCAGLRGRGGWSLWALRSRPGANTPARCRGRTPFALYDAASCLVFKNIMFWVYKKLLSVVAALGKVNDDKR